MLANTTSPYVYIVGTSIHKAAFKLPLSLNFSTTEKNIETKSASFQSDGLTLEHYYIKIQTGDKQ
jgi:hypothetical protein